MSNLVLYRKYRPQSFSEIIGQEHVVQTLTNAISAKMISHAYLFSGPRGSGKTTIARLLAKAVNCQNRSQSLNHSATQPLNHSITQSLNYEPCNKCSSCTEIMEGRALDLIEIDAASHRGIEEIRELRDGIRFGPTKSKYKVFILDEAHQLTKEAANALLKTLEEPPSHAIFILATTEIHKMIPTIISRCQRFDFRKFTLPEILKRLDIISEKENIKIEKAALELIAINSGGSLRDGESLLGQVLTFAGTLGKQKEIKAEDIKSLLGLVEISSISQFIDLILEKKAGQALQLLSDIMDRGLDFQDFTKALIKYLRQALILKISGIPSPTFAHTKVELGIEAKTPIIGGFTPLENSLLAGLTVEECQKLKKQAGAFPESDLRKTIGLFLEAENRMKYASIPQLPLELASVEVIERLSDRVAE